MRKIRENKRYKNILRKKEKSKCKKHRKNKLIHKEFGQEVGNIFTEALGEIKIEKEAKRLKAEGKTWDDFSEEEIVNRYID